MYWGDTNIFLASSPDFFYFNKKEKTDSVLRVIMSPRKRRFDSDLVEPGPPAMLTDKGILLLYNSRNAPTLGDSSLRDGTYAAGQALLDNESPGKVIDRSAQYFIKPEAPYEIDGQVNDVCYIEGLIQFKGKWFLYYGTADSKIAVAVH